jgi:hypothetical protein
MSFVKHLISAYVTHDNDYSSGHCHITSSWQSSTGSMPDIDTINRELSQDPAFLAFHQMLDQEITDSLTDPQELE